MEGMAETNGKNGQSLTPAGGLGGGLTALKERRLERRAIMERWNVPPEKLAKILERQLAIAESDDARESTRAFLAVLQARQQDLHIEQAELADAVAETPQQPQQHLHAHVVVMKVGKGISMEDL